MCDKNIVNKGLLLLSILLLVLFNQPMKAQAFVNLHKERGHDVDKSRDKGDDHSRDGDKKDEHHDDHQDEHHEQ